MDETRDQNRALPSQIAQLFFPPSSHYRNLFSPEKSRIVLQRRESIDTAENELADVALAPEVEGRIFIVTDKASSSIYNPPVVWKSVLLLDRCSCVHAIVLYQLSDVLADFSCMNLR